MEPIQLTFDTTTDELTRAIEAYCAIYFYSPTINGEPNPQTPPEFFKQKCIDWVVGNVTSYEMSKVSQAAIQDAQDNTDEIVIT